MGRAARAARDGQRPSLAAGERSGARQRPEEQLAQGGQVSRCCWLAITDAHRTDRTGRMCTGR